MLMAITFRPVQYLVIGAGYLVVLLTSGYLVTHFIGGAGKEASEETRARYDLGAIIGKCENLLVVALVLADALTGLAIVFTAKSILRRDDIRSNPRFYLGGTMVNFTYSVMAGFAMRIILDLLGQPLG